MRLRPAFVFILAITVSSVVFSQDSATVAPGARYDGGFLHRLFNGSGWRDLWTTPMHVEQLDLSSFERGVQVVAANPVIKIMRLRSGAGREYTFWALERDPHLVFTRPVLNTLSEDVAIDLLSATHPAASIVASSLLSAAGIPSSTYEIVQLPDDPRFGAYQAAFKGIVGVLKEELPGKAILTQELLERVDRDHREQIDAHAFAKLRLMDLFFGDHDIRDRWQWIGRSNGSAQLWQPTVGHHDFAFARTDGLGWNAAKRLIHRDTTPQITSVQLDHRFLSGIERNTWDSLALAIHTALTDEAIEAAVQSMPPELYAGDGPALAAKLKDRRTDFVDAASAYYDMLTEAVDIHGSDLSEYVDVERVNNDSVTISLQARDKTTGGAKGRPFFARTFDRKETDEIRLYLKGGDDFTVVKGNATGSIPIRIIGGEGADELADSSQVRGNLLGFLPIKTSKAATYFYENDRKAEFIYGTSTRALPDEDSVMYGPMFRDRGHSWRSLAQIGVNSDDLVFVGAGARYTNYGFRAVPYQDRATIKAGYAFGPGRFLISYDHEFPNVYDGTLNLFAQASGLEAVNFFGYGNNTTYHEALAKNDVYAVKHMEYSLIPRYSYSPLDRVKVGVYGGIRLNRTDTTDGADSAVVRMLKPYGVQDAMYATAGLSGSYDSRDNSVAPREGVLFTIGTSWNPEIFDNAYAYTKAHTELRGFYTAPVLGGITLAVRARGEKLFGNRFPFYDAVYLGGIKDLRGYTRQRFAGDASFLATAELRVNISRATLFLPTEFGVHAFAEEGRVFYDGETSEARHGSFGGGIWLAPLDARHTVALTIARSTEQTTFAITSGFAF